MRLCNCLGASISLVMNRESGIHKVKREEDSRF